MDEEDRNQLVLWGGAAYSGAYCGLACAYSYNGWSSSYAGIGSRLAVKSSEIAIYFGEQFKELWKDFLIGKSNHTGEAASKRPFPYLLNL